MENLPVLLKRSRDILRTEGLRATCKRVTDYITSPFFKLEYFNLYEHTHRVWEAAGFAPRIAGLTCRVIKSNSEADALAAEMGTDFRSYIVHSKNRLDSGALAFCFFNGKELAHVGWVATNEKAKKAVDGRPYKVDFAHHQACTGGTFTPPKYRSKGLMVYGYYMRLAYLRENGYPSSRSVTSVNNAASNKAHARFKPKLVAKARHLRLLWWESWKETPGNTSG
jgi:hypothetical protein